ncbi:MAG TPA: hypothetical protein VN846_03500 [Candidatus Cybelea sp.]|nr:hypothetical protein [Candidatus Cybelea sp.]
MPLPIDSGKTPTDANVHITSVGGVTITESDRHAFDYPFLTHLA